MKVRIKPKTQEPVAPEVPEDSTLPEPKFHPRSFKFYRHLKELIRAGEATIYQVETYTELREAYASRASKAFLRAGRNNFLCGRITAQKNRTKELCLTLRNIPPKARDNLFNLYRDFFDCLDRCAVTQSEFETRKNPGTKSNTEKKGA